jgi:quinolinate synthase
MRESELKEKIRALAAERDALILAHNYQRDEIQEIADITGDSLGLSQEAARTERQVIVFCGVHPLFPHVLLGQAGGVLQPLAGLKSAGKSILAD